MDSLTGALSNPWIVTIGSGIVIGVLAWFGRKLFSNRDPAVSTTARSGNQNQNTTVTTNFFNSPAPHIIEKAAASGSDEDILTLKSKVRILFIENGSFKQITNLQNSGWNVQQIKDVTDLDSSEIRNSQIIFVDFKDVGRQLSEDEGLGIVKALKRRYGKSKWVILYSAHSFRLNVFDGGADSYLAKNSTFIEIEQKIIEGAHATTR